MFTHLENSKESMEKSTPKEISVEAEYKIHKYANELEKQMKRNYIKVAMW